MRATIIASTWLRLSDGLGSISLSRPSLLSVPSTAATWPWGRDLTMSKASSRPTSGSSLRRRRKVSTLCLGHEEMLVMVRFLTFPFSRHPSRRRIAGLEFLFGTMSIYMATVLNESLAHVKHKITSYMGTYFDHFRAVLPMNSSPWHDSSAEIIWNFGLTRLRPNQPNRAFEIIGPKLGGPGRIP